MIIEYSKIRLDSGVIAVVVEVLKDGEAFLVEVETEGQGDSWEIISVPRSQVVSLVEEEEVSLAGGML